MSSPGSMQGDQGSAEGDASVGNASIHWSRDGQGPAVVFLHGFPLSGRTWDAVIARLRARFTCGTLDLVGRGQSRSVEAADYSSPGQGRAFSEALSQLGVGTY